MTLYNDRLAMEDSDYSSGTHNHKQRVQDCAPPNYLL